MPIPADKHEKSTVTTQTKKKNSGVPVAAVRSRLEGGVERIGSFYSSLAGFLLRGAEGLSDRRAERRSRRIAGSAAQASAATER